MYRILTLSTLGIMAWLGLNHNVLASHPLEEWDMELDPSCFAHHQKQNPDVTPHPFKSQLLSEYYPANSDHVRIDGYNNAVGEGKPFQYRPASSHEKKDSNNEIVAH